MTFLTRIVAACFISTSFLHALEPGFEPLFDGTSLEGWSNFGTGGVVVGEIARVKKGGSLVYEKAQVPDDFELRFDWKVAKGVQQRGVLPAGAV